MNAAGNLDTVHWFPSSSAVWFCHSRYICIIIIHCQYLESPHFLKWKCPFFFKLLRVKIDLPGIPQQLISADMWSFLSGSPRLLWNAGSATSKRACVNTILWNNLPHGRRARGRIIKQLRSEQRLICAAVFSCALRLRWAVGRKDGTTRCL